MPAKISRLIPLPMPRSVICSPSHMMNVVPPVSVRIVIRLKPIPGFSTRPCLVKIAAMPIDCSAPRITVMYRVHCVIFRRPSSPSFWMRASGSYTTVSSWKMIEAVIYGMMPSAKIVIRRRFPPPNRSINPSADPLCWLNSNSS